MQDRSSAHGSDALPPLAWIAGALRKTTEHLARELAQPADRAPDWSEQEWRVAQSVAVMHGASALLAQRLRWCGPQAWQEFLRGQAAEILQQHQRITGLLAKLDDEARRSGVAIVALKGAALYQRGLYSPGQRPMADIDLLVDPHDVAAAGNILARLGYRQGSITWKHIVFVPQSAEMTWDFRERGDNPVKIELHTRIVERVPIREIDISTQVRLPRAPPGLNGYPSLTSLLQHMLLHAAGAIALRSLRLVHLHDIALLCARIAREEAGRTPPIGGWWAFPPLVLARRYYPELIAEDLVTTAAAQCPWLLTRYARHWSLTDVSLSHLRIPAFPGLEWCSLTEMLQYTTRRIFPDRETRSGRRTVKQVAPWHAQDPWYELSQTRRILRWLVARPARVDTLISVRAALQQEL